MQRTSDGVDSLNLEMIMIRLTIKVVAISTVTSSGKTVEQVLHNFEIDQYDISDIDKFIAEALSGAQALAGFSSLSSLKPLKPEVTISLFADEEEIRPALHLSVETMRDIAEAGASLDFDPYVYP